jgi:hypothetical protein
MRLRTVTVAALVAVAAAGTLSPALAAPKTVKESYTATAPVPDPTPKMPFAGKLQVDLTGFQGDWALAVLNDKGEKIAEHDNSDLPLDAPSQVVLKVKKPTELIIRACNFAGGPTAQVDVVATANS